MRSPDQHLSADEMELLENEERLSGEVGNRLGPAREHAESCPACRRRLEVYPSSRTKLEKLRAPQRAPKGPDCPPIEIWLNLAGGLLTTAEQDRYTAHAAQCDSCGPVLREVVEDFSEPVTDQEKEALAGLEANPQQWQQKKAKESPSSNTRSQISTANSSSPRWFGFLRWASVAALVIFAGVAFSLFKFGAFSDKDTVTAVDQLLAKAYTEHRTMELRIPGATYGPMRTERGANKSHLDRPADLFDAEAIIRRQLERSANNPQWLDARGRAELLEADFDSAVETLTQANRSAPDSIVILVDLATAYFQRAAERNRPQDYGKAEDLLGQVLEKSPHDPIALFNRALVNEEQTLYPQAVEDWKEYLRVDPEGAWAEQARTHLDRLQRKLVEHKNAALQPLAEPAEFEQLAQSSDPNVLAQLDPHVEEYQEFALRQWLGHFVVRYHDKDETRNQAAVLQTLATLLLERHGDHWLTDLVGESRSSEFAKAADHLRSALILAVSGNATMARDEAENAAIGFARAGSDAGRLRAEVEVVHSLRRAQEGEKCLEKASTLAKELEHRPYPWMLGQLNLDLCSCALMSGKFDLANAYIAVAQHVARQSGYRGLELRSIGMTAAIKSDQGDLNSAWAQDQSGLLEYWSGAFVSPVRAQQFYDDLSYSAERLAQWHSALAFAQESARMLSLSGNRQAEALVRRHLARIAVRVGDPDLANTELAKSSELLAALPLTDETRADRLYAETALAEVEIQQGRLREAEERLISIRRDVERVSSFTIQQRFYGTYGRLLLKTHREGAAEQALLQSIDIADLNLKEISDPSSRFLWSQENSDAYRALVDLEFLRGDVNKALTIWEWYRSALIGHSSGKAQSLRLFWQQGGLRNLFSSLADETVIAYALLPDGLAIWVVDQNGVQGRLTTVDPSYLAALADDFSKLCSDRASDLAQIKIRGRQLFEVLLAPVINDIHSGRVLVIEADDFMSDLPFQAIVVPDSHYAGEIYNLDFSPGLLYNAYLRKGSSISNRSAALVVGSIANITSADTLLQASSEILGEADDVAGRFGSAKALLGASATVEAMESWLPSAEIFHFVGHAISSPAKEGLLVFGDSHNEVRGTRLWDGHRITRTMLKRCKLVVLAACSTGGSYRGQRETHGALMRNIFVAAVPNVVASRWDVDDLVTRRLMNSFYSALLSGEPISKAIQSAEEKLRSDPETHHPYYWAAFAAFGRV